MKKSNMVDKNSKIKLNVLLCLCVLLISITSLTAQRDKEQQKTIKESQQLLSSAATKIYDENFVEAEVNYRKEIAINPSGKIGKYNLGNAYYKEEKNKEAKRRFAQAASTAQTKTEKHRAYHNLGNTLMKDKDYQHAVEAYKNALRNNPSDDETRYNFALAKDLLEKNPPQGGDGDDKNKDQKENQDQDKKEGEDQKDDGKEKEGDQGDKKEDDSKGEEEKDKNKGDDKKDKQKKPDPSKEEKKDGKGDQPKEQQQKPIPGQLSPQQVKNLLEAMNNEEKKVQDKINAKKQKGVKVKPNKDW